MQRLNQPRWRVQSGAGSRSPSHLQSKERGTVDLSHIHSLEVVSLLGKVIMLTPNSVGSNKHMEKKILF